jgi:hypothetical protein
MINFLYFLFLIATISHIPIIYKQLKYRTPDPIFKFIFWNTIIGFIGYILFYLFSLYVQNSYPVGHFVTLFQFYTFLYLLISLNFPKLSTIILGLISTLIFIYYVINKNELFKIDEVNFTYCNIIYLIYSFWILKYNFGMNRNKIKRHVSVFAIIFISISSKIILGIFEKEIRSQETIISLILIIMFNVVIIFQNLGFYYSLWKLKEA